MVGQAVLRECLLDADVQTVLSIGRSVTGQRHEKLRELVHKDMLDYTGVENRLSGFDACFFCIGVSSAGLTEERYRHVTYDIPMAAAQTLIKLNPDMTFIYVSAMGADSTERGRMMWARVKGSTENALLRLPFKAAVMIRPAVIVPMHGIKSRTALYRVLYSVLRPLLPVVNAVAPKYVTTTEQLGRAMLEVAKRGAPKAVLESSDINSIRTR